MHLFFENVLQVLVNLWTASFKNLDQGTGSYELNPGVWDAIGAATAACGNTIPSSFGQRPVNIATDAGRKASTADSWSFWLLYLGPVVLHNRFTKQVYYNHFIKFASLVMLCLEFEINRSQIDVIRRGFAEWVEEFERLYYQYNPDRLSACPLTIHALLHVADSIEWCGPAWAYWSFPTERYCNRIQPAIKSRRYPWACIDIYITDYAVLSIIKMNYDLGETLRMQGQLGSVGRKRFSHPSYQDCILLSPCRPYSSITQFHHDKIVVHFSTRFKTDVASIRQYYKRDQVEQWAKVRFTDDGDDIKAATIDGDSEDKRDATYLRYDMLVDLNTLHPNREENLEKQQFFGQLQNIFVVRFPPAPELEQQFEETYILAGIQKCHNVKYKNGMRMPYYKNMGGYEVVDMSCVQCVVGRIKATQNHWAIIDRSGALQHSYYVRDD
ncbi:hypothetical protein K435DRAFT_822023 [Dendrothele bispora CBS 962.96]|uniref:Uncharacterized protein n=1 Tax=Dendrothele bispora (strain CBS 962.96) TaxID=1314807 RepID=A0A4S8LDN1_DENBC|nr:hypothetical protein K435DRAFT_822023 [Dendrothele bispora CBS 962.96]